MSDDRLDLIRQKRLSIMRLSESSTQYLHFDQKKYFNLLLIQTFPYNLENICVKIKQSLASF
jgi:hypothetical protein